MIAGDRVRLKANAPLRVQHPEMASAIGVVSSIMQQNGGALLHVRFGKPVNLVVMNAHSGQFEEVDRLEPRLPGK